MIPALESVNADEYNKKFEAILKGKVQSEPEPLIQYDRAPESAAEAAGEQLAQEAAEENAPSQDIQPDTKAGFIKAEEQAQTSPENLYGGNGQDDTLDPFAPGAGKEAGNKKKSSGKSKHKPEKTEQISYYSEDGEDDTLDPFAPGSGEIPLRELETKHNESIGSKLKRSFGKIFTDPDGED